MRIGRRLTSGVVVAVLVTVAQAMTATAGAAPAAPANLYVEGGETTWHHEDRFSLRWDKTPIEESTVVAAHYRVHDALGRLVVGDTRIANPGWCIGGIRVRAPGSYEAEVWLEDGAGNEGPAATVTLRFDDARPAQIEPVPFTAWIGRAGFPHTIRLGHPGGDPPVSGIRGYAVSIDSAPNGNPCAAASACTDAETDLRGGVYDDALPITGLPEGTSYVHAVAVSGSGMKSALPGHAALHVDTTDPVATLAGMPSGWTKQAVTLTARATDSGSGMAGSPGGGATPFTAIRVDAEAPTVASGSSVSTTVIGEGAHEIAYYARDAAGNVNDGSTSNGVNNRPPSTAVVRIDRSPPVVAFDSSQDPRDPELIRVRVRDALSGGDPTQGWIGVRRVGSDDRFDTLPAEPAAAGFQAHWDSDAYPAGEYEFRATGYDMAGNTATATLRADGASMVLPNPLKTSTTLRAGFGGEMLVWHRCVWRGPRRRCRRQAVRDLSLRPAERLVPYGRGILFSGDLTAGIRARLAEMPVRVVERFGAGADLMERVSTVRTAADGSFAVRLAPGPSREVTAGFGGTRTLTRSEARPVRLLVRSSLRFHASSELATVGGRPVIFSGSVAASGSAIPPDGKSVQLQFRLPGMPWSEFRTVTTDGRGRFRYPYRFSDNDSRGVRFQFRAYAPAQSGWPYEPGSSRPVAVRGR